MILWHTDTDKFESGQWVNHRVFEGESDVAPNGNLVVYGARQGRISSNQEKWVAVSRPPYFTALALWPVAGPGGGGGVFKDGQTLMLYGQIGDVKRGYKVPLAVEHNIPLAPVNVTVEDHAGWFSATETVRLHRDKWRYDAVSKWWERWSRGDTWRLCWKRSVHLEPEKGKSTSILQDCFAVRFRDACWLLVDASWAGIDQRGRLVFARDGRLFAGNVTSEGVGETLLADFSEEKPDPQPSPASALRWPR
jgi:hypothetical protein